MVQDSLHQQYLVNGKENGNYYLKGLYKGIGMEKKMETIFYRVREVYPEGPCTQ